jgi:hypothetical protein
MKERLLKNWTIVRVIYLAMGLLLLSSSIAANEWLGALFGSYVAAMGLFAFGCAGGNCAWVIPTKSGDENALVEYEEVK